MDGRDLLEGDHDDCREEEQRQAGASPHEYLAAPPVSPESKVGKTHVTPTQEEEHDGEDDVLRRGTPDERKPAEGLE